MKILGPYVIYLLLTIYYAADPTAAKDCLRVFDTRKSKEVDELKEWYCAIVKERKTKSLDVQDSALAQLKAESCAASQCAIGTPAGAKKRMSMCEAHATLYPERATNCPNRVLNEAECLVIKMYTSGFKGVYAENLRLGRWQQHKVFTSLLYGAAVKLSKLKTKQILTLYKGLARKFDPPQTGRFYFKEFILATSNVRSAIKDGMDTVIHFETSPEMVWADISSISVNNKLQDQILISPFEAFQFVKTDSMWLKNVVNREIQESKC